MEPFDPFSDEAEDLVVAQEHPSLRVDEERLRRIVTLILDGEEAQLAYLALVLTDHDEVLQLNRAHLQHDYHTDVLSFPLSEEPGVVDGEMYVDLDTAQERCSEFENSFEDEALRYAVHGLLHLLGYDDASDADRAAMRQLEDHYLAQLAAE